MGRATRRRRGCRAVLALVRRIIVVFLFETLLPSTAVVGSKGWTMKDLLVSGLLGLSRVISRHLSRWRALSVVLSVEALLEKGGGPIVAACAMIVEF